MSTLSTFEIKGYISIIILALIGVVALVSIVLSIVQIYSKRKYENVALPTLEVEENEGDRSTFGFSSPQTKLQAPLPSTDYLTESSLSYLDELSGKAEETPVEDTTSVTINDFLK